MQPIIQSIEIKFLEDGKTVKQCVKCGKMFDHILDACNHVTEKHPRKKRERKNFVRIECDRHEQWEKCEIETCERCHGLGIIWQCTKCRQEFNSLLEVLGHHALDHPKPKRRKKK